MWWCVSDLSNCQSEIVARARKRCSVPVTGAKKTHNLGRVKIDSRRIHDWLATNQINRNVFSRGRHLFQSKAFFLMSTRIFRINLRRSSMIRRVFLYHNNSKLMWVPSNGRDSHKQNPNLKGENPFRIDKGSPPPHCHGRSLFFLLSRIRALRTGSH